jgi:hypothetical protein
MLDSPLFKRFLILTIFISSASLYTLIFIPERIRDLVQMAGLGIIFLFLIVNTLFGTTESIRQNFRVEVYLFLIATFLSMFIANAYHDQNFSTTLIAQRFMYFYFFYFFLHYMKADVSDIERLVIPLAWAYVIIYLIQYVLYPTIILDTRVVMTRGTVRIFMPGGGFMFLAYFRSLQSLMQTHDIKHGINCMVFFLIPGILQGTRQSLASFALVTAAYVFFSKQEKSKFFIIAMLSLAAVAIFVIFHEIFIELIALSQEQAADEKTNIRVVSMKYFLGDFMPHTLAYIFGNGQDSMNAVYGRKISALRNFGLHQSDIGLLGDYSKFGILFAIAQLSITLRMIFGKLPKKIAYFRYFFISRLLVMFSGGNMFGSANAIVFIVMVLYMYDCYRHEEEEEKNPQIQISEEETEIRPSPV